VESQRLQLGALGAELALLQGQLADKEQLVRWGGGGGWLLLGGCWGAVVGCGVVLA
jgi:hypothetical protein